MATTAATILGQLKALLVTGGTGSRADGERLGPEAKHRAILELRRLADGLELEERRTMLMAPQTAMGGPFGVGNLFASPFGYPRMHPAALPSDLGAFDLVRRSLEVLENTNGTSDTAAVGSARRALQIAEFFAELWEERRRDRTEEARPSGTHSTIAALSAVLNGTDYAGQAGDGVRVPARVAATKDFLATVMEQMLFTEQNGYPVPDVSSFRQRLRNEANAAVKTKQAPVEERPTVTAAKPKGRQRGQLKS